MTKHSRLRSLWSDLADSASAITSVHVSQQHHFGSVTLHADDMAVPALGYVIGNLDLLAREVERGLDSDARTRADAALSMAAICVLRSLKQTARISAWASTMVT